ncbi:ABC transporter permease [Aquimarina algiphila]|uniref:ABC transporter permease n=1 Tax=Aquimarina algiphila TaxID=2047982 RepID=UPI00232E5499|nr:ABC transporter permease [Aquimarina algiphila]
MYNLYFKIAIRYLLKNKRYSFINILGLAIGVASFILIMVYVNYENNYDKFTGSENVYRVYMDYKKGDHFIQGDAQTYNMAGPTFEKEFPEVLDYTRFYRLDKTTLKIKDKVIEETNGNVADPSYFEIFNQTLLKGDLATALVEPNSIVLTETVAAKLFGNDNPLGKTISVFWGDPTLATVTGIMKDIPENTHFKISYLLSYTTMKGWEAIDENQKIPNWNNNVFYTYLKLSPNADITALRKKIIESDFEDDPDERHNIEPIEDIHLYSNKPYEAELNGSVVRVKFLTAIAFIILILSWLNYINLSTTKSLERAKEIGIRKVAGAQKQQLIIQSLLESIILNMIAIIMAITIAIIILPLYNSFTGKALTFELASLINILPILGFILLGMMLAGLYPAMLLSNYSPSKALKGKIRTSASGLNIRKGLIITQFLATIVLLIGTIVVTKQINYIQKQPIGSDLNNIVAIHGEILNKKSDSLLIQDFTALSSEIRKLSMVKDVTTTQTYPGDGYENLSSFMGITHPDGIEEGNVVYYNYRVESNYFDLMDIEFLAGSTFLPNSKRNDRNLVINEKFAKEVGIANPKAAINQKVKFWDVEWNIIGVIKNYHHFGLKTPMQPVMIRYGKTRNNLLVKLDPEMASTIGYQNSLSQLQNVWEEVFPESTFNYTFINKKFQAQYEEDTKFSEAFKVFTALAIFIAALGLFGLTSYTCIQRKKEIGIRKVNGASIFKILKLLNIDFIKWVGIAFIIAVPIAWYAMNSWLENFAVKTNISWWVFILAGIMALGITLLTVSWQSFMAANGNPVDALRDE